MAGRSRFRRVLGFVVSVIAVAVLMLIGTEYWRATKAGAQYSRALNQDVRGFIGGNTMAGGDDMPATRAADFAATVGALDQANERVRALGEERNQLLQERDQLNQLRNDLTGRLARAEDEVAALQARVGELNSRVDDGSGESARMNQSLRELEERLKTVTAERDRLRDELAAARQQLASNDAQPPSSIAAAPAPVRHRPWNGPRRLHLHPFRRHKGDLRGSRTSGPTPVLRRHRSGKSRPRHRRPVQYRTASRPIRPAITRRRAPYGSRWPGKASRVPSSTWVPCCSRGGSVRPS